MPESNGNNSSDRLDRIGRIVEVLANTQSDMAETQAAMQQDIKNLYLSQVAMGEAVNTLSAEMKQGFAGLREAQQHTDDRLNTLIDVVDKWIRRP